MEGKGERGAGRLAGERFNGDRGREQIDVGIDETRVEGSSDYIRRSRGCRKLTPERGGLGLSGALNV